MAHAGMSTALGHGVPGVGIGHPVSRVGISRLMAVMRGNISDQCAFRRLHSVSAGAVLHLMSGVRIVYGQMVLVFCVFHGVP